MSKGLSLERVIRLYGEYADERDIYVYLRGFGEFLPSQQIVSTRNSRGREKGRGKDIKKRQKLRRKKLSHFLKVTRI